MSQDAAAPSTGPVELCVLLWAREGHEQDLALYEDRVLALVPGHGGTVRQRVRGDGSGGHPLEVQLYSFPDEAALNAYLADDRRVALAAERDRVVARTELIRVALV